MTSQNQVKKLYPLVQYVFNKHEENIPLAEVSAGSTQYDSAFDAKLLIETNLQCLLLFIDDLGIHLEGKIGQE